MAGSPVTRIGAVTPRSFRRAALAASVAVALCAAAPASAVAESFVVNARGSATGLGTVLRIGDFRPSRDASLSAAIAAYGQPSSIAGGGRESCTVRWRPLGVRIVFVELGGGDACDPAHGKAQVAVLRDTRRWRTVKGLRLRDSLDKLKRLYPRAPRTGRAYRLVSGRSVFGAGGRYAVLSARVADERVTSYRLFIGAAGE